MRGRCLRQHATGVTISTPAGSAPLIPSCMHAPCMSGPPLPPGSCLDAAACQSVFFASQIELRLQVLGAQAFHKRFAAPEHKGRTCRVARASVDTRSDDADTTACDIVRETLTAKCVRPLHSSTLHQFVIDFYHHGVGSKSTFHRRTALRWMLQKFLYESAAVGGQGRVQCHRTQAVRSHTSHAHAVFTARDGHDTTQLQLRLCTCTSACLAALDSRCTRTCWWPRAWACACSCEAADALPPS